MIVALNPALPERPDLDPTDREGRPASGANVLTQGFRTPIPRVAEDAEAVNRQTRALFHALNPRNDFQAWLVEDTALVTLRLERVARIERRERDRIALRAEWFWDDDRRLEVEQVAARLEGDPAATVAALRRSPHGCEWMMSRWAMLARVADLDGRWDEAQTSLAFDLLGTPGALRRGTPGQAVDEYGTPVGEAGGDLAAIARRQVDRLKAARDAAKDADGLDRAMAMADMADASSPELRRLRRYEATLHKRMRWNLHQLQQIPLWAAPHPSLECPNYGEPAPTPEPVAEAPAAEAPVVDAPAVEAPEASDAGTAEVVDVEAVAAVAPSRASRPDPVRARAEARRRARRKVSGRPDA